MASGAATAGNIETIIAPTLPLALAPRTICFNADTMAGYLFPQAKGLRATAAQARHSDQWFAKTAKRSESAKDNKSNRLAADITSAGIIETVEFSVSAEGARMRVPTLQVRVSEKVRND